MPSDLETLKFGDVFSQQNGRSELATHSCNSGFTPRPSRDHVKHVLETGCFETIIIVPFGTQQVHSVMLPTHCQSFTTERKERPCQAVFGPESMNGRGSSGQQPFMSGTVFTHTLFKGLCVFWMHFIRVWVLWHHHVFSFDIWRPACTTNGKELPCQTVQIGAAPSLEERCAFDHPCI